MRPSVAAQRGSSTRETVVEQKPTGFVQSSLSKRKQVFQETTKEITPPMLAAMFSEEDPAAFVRVSAGMTLNLGDYESLRIDCSVTLPAHRSQLQEAYELASNFVADRIADEQTSWLGKGNERNGKK